MKTSPLFFIQSLLAVITLMAWIPSAESGDRSVLREFGGKYSGEFRGSFDGQSAASSGIVRVPRGNWRKITASINRNGSRKTINGTVNRIRCRANRVYYSGRMRTNVKGISVSGTFRATARQNSRSKVLRIPLRLSRELLGKRYTVSGRFLGKK